MDCTKSGIPMSGIPMSANPRSIRNPLYTGIPLYTTKQEYSELTKTTYKLFSLSNKFSHPSLIVPLNHRNDTTLGKRIEMNIHTKYSTKTITSIPQAHSSHSSSKGSPVSASAPPRGSSSPAKRQGFRRAA